MEPLKLSDIKKEFKFTMNKNTSFDGREMLGDRPITVDFDVWLSSRNMNLQRPLCWTLIQKQEFIISILKGNPIPKVSIISHKPDETSDKIYQIIDGKQRISTYIAFMKGEFTLRAITAGNGEYSFNDLDKECQQILLRFYFIADMAYSYYDAPISDADKIDWFYQVNFTGTQQEVEHMDNLRK